MATRCSARSGFSTRSRPTTPRACRRMTVTLRSASRSVQPIALDWWPYAEAEPKDEFTTVMNWASYAPKEWNGRTYGQKDIEFLKFKTLPQRTKQKLTMAMGQGVGSKRPTEELRALGWTIVEAGEALPDHHKYRDFLAA